jgi:hypothetical protein
VRCSNNDLFLCLDQTRFNTIRFYEVLLSFFIVTCIIKGCWATKKDRFLKTGIEKPDR